MIIIYVGVDFSIVSQSCTKFAQNIFGYRLNLQREAYIPYISHWQTHKVEMYIKNNPKG